MGKIAFIPAIVISTITTILVLVAFALFLVELREPLIMKINGG